MRFIISCFLFFTVIPLFSQENAVSSDVIKIKIDSLYREDQFYFSLALNSLQKKPAGLTQDKFSSGFSLGFLRDFPVNKNRTLAIAPGIGVAYNNYNQILFIAKLNQDPVYTIIASNSAYNKNKFTQILIEAPIEFRWRSSTFDSHKFWRIYGGFKMGYLLYDKSVYEGAYGKIAVKNNKDFTRFQYGTYVSAGYNSINVVAYYGLNSLLQSVKIEDKPIEMNLLSIGIMFYIL